MKKRSRKRKRSNVDDSLEPKQKKQKLSTDLVHEFLLTEDNDILLELGKMLHFLPLCLQDAKNYKKLPISGKMFLKELKSYLKSKKELLMNGAIQKCDCIIFGNGSLKDKSMDFTELFYKCDLNADELLIKVDREFSDIHPKLVCSLEPDDDL